MFYVFIDSDSLECPTLSAFTGANQMCSWLFDSNKTVASDSVCNYNFHDEWRLIYLFLLCFIHMNGVPDLGAGKVCIWL